MIENILDQYHYGVLLWRFNFLSAFDSMVPALNVVLLMLYQNY